AQGLFVCPWMLFDYGKTGENPQVVAIGLRAVRDADSRKAIVLGPPCVEPREDLVAGAVSFQHEEDIDVLLADELDELVDVPLAARFSSALPDVPFHDPQPNPAGT